MNAAERISTWITNQRKEGRTDDDLNGVIFILDTDKAARITKVNDKFDLEILMPPFAVDFTESE